MAKVSLNQASKDNGVSLPTLSRWRKAGRISAERNGSGGYLIDTSEYDRILELKKQSSFMKHSTQGVVKDHATPPETPNEMRVIQVEVEVLRERIKDKDKTIEDLREDRDDWKKQAQTLLLQSSIRNPTLTESLPNTNPERKKSSFNLPESATTGFIALLLVTLAALAVMVFLTNSNQTELSRKDASYLEGVKDKKEKIDFQGFGDFLNPKKAYTPAP